MTARFATYATENAIRKTAHAAKAENAAKTEPPAKTVGLPVMGKFATLNHRNAAQARKRALT